MDTLTLYAHAMAIEREAVERYAEFAERMDREGNFAVAALFRMLSTLEAKHLDELKRRTAKMNLPPLEADYSWPGPEAPETAGHTEVTRGMTQRRGLEMALQAEKRARAFFEQAARVADDADARTLAREMAAEEAEHAELIERMLSGMPGGAVDWPVDMTHD